MEPFGIQNAECVLSAFKHEEDSSWCNCHWDTRLLYRRSLWEIYYGKLTRLGIETVKNDLDNKSATEELKKLKAPLNGYTRDELCENCVGLNKDIKALQVNYGPQYRRALEMYLDVIGKPDLTDEAYEEWKKKFHSEKEFHFEEHGYDDRADWMAEYRFPERLRCLRALKDAVISGVMSKSRAIGVRRIPGDSEV